MNNVQITNTMRRSENMRRIRSKDTKPELSVRSLLHSMGFRYRLHNRELPGCPDIIFPSRKKVIFVHGCFWHQHTGCRISHKPKTQVNYWGPKLRRNKKRDKLNGIKLRQSGWDVLVIWECEVEKYEKDPEALKKLLG